MTLRDRPRRGQRRAWAAAALAVAVGVALAGGAALLLLPTDAPAALAPTGDDAREPEQALGAVVGRVRDPNGNGVPDAVVRIDAHGLRTTTAVEGQYHFYSVPEGPIVVIAELPGHPLSTRTVHVRQGVVHEINLRVDPGSWTGAEVVHQLNGRLACAAVLAGAGVQCDEPTDHVVNGTRGMAYAIVELAWAASAPLNLTVGPADDALDPVTGRPATAWHATEGPSPLRLVVPLDGDADDLRVSVRHPAFATGVPGEIPYVAFVSLFREGPPPDGYEIASRAEP